jgi:hypothetical protein
MASTITDFDEEVNRRATKIAKLPEKVSNFNKE